MKMGYLHFVYIIFILINFIQLIHGQIQTTSRNIQSQSKIEETVVSNRVIGTKDNKKIYKNIIRSFPIRFLSKPIETDETPISISSSFNEGENESSKNIIKSTFNNINEISSEPTLFNTELATNSKRVEEPTIITSSFAKSNEPKTSYNGKTDFNFDKKSDSILYSTNDYEEPSTSNNENIEPSTSHLNFEPDTTNDNNVESNSLLESSLNSIYVKTTIISSTIPKSEIPSTTTEIINTNSSLILLGFSHLNISNSDLSFFIHFVLLDGYLASNNLKFPVEIKYNNFLRLLENHEANCILAQEFNQKINYFCTVKTQSSKINNIKIIPDFNFNLDKPNIKFSSIVAHNLDDVQQILNKTDKLTDSNLYLYILTNSKIINKEAQTFTISGIIKSQKPKFQKINMTLIANVENGKEITETQLNCNVIDIYNNSYIIKCKVNTYSTYIMQNSISFIADEILLINFDKDEDSQITFIPENATNGTTPGPPPPPEDDEGLSTIGTLAIIIIIISLGFLMS